MEDRLQAKLSHHPINRLASPLVAVEQQASFRCLMIVDPSHQPMVVVAEFLSEVC